MNKLAQLGSILIELLPGVASKPGISVSQVVGGLILGAAGMTSISGGSIEVGSLTGPYKFTPAGATEEQVRSARALAGNLLKPEIAAVCEKSPLLGKTVGILTPKMDNAFSVKALRYVPCTKEELTQEIMFLHGDDMKRIAGNALTEGPREVRAFIIDKEPVMPLGNDQALGLKEARP
jgi:hypothetical protein